MSQKEPPMKSNEQGFKLLLRLWSFVRPDRYIFLLAMFLSPMGAVLALSQPYIIKKVIDEHIVTGILDGVEILFLIYAGLLVFDYILSASFTTLIAWGGTRTQVRLREFLFQRVLSLPQKFFDSRPAGVLLTRLTSDIDSLGEVIGSGVATLGLDLLMIIGALSMMFYLDWEMTVVLLILSPVLFVVIELVRRRLRIYFMKIRDAIASVNAHLAEQIDGVEILQLFSAEERSAKEFLRRNSEFRDACTRSNIYDSLMFAVVDGLGSVFIAVLLWYGSGVISQSGLPVPEIEPRSAGLMIAFIDYLNRLLMPIRDLSSKVAVIQRALAALDKVFGLVDASEPMPRAGKALPELNGQIEVKDLSFSYSKDGVDVLKNISFSVNPGEVVAIVGSSGSGKSTITRLIDKSYTGYRGTILVDGHDFSKISIDDLRRQIVSVRQDIQVFSESIRFNVQLENPSVTDIECDLAVRQTYFSGVIDRMGWSHVLKERGGGLSVGESQLLTFARTMAHKPSVIILDEATASVDSITEALIQNAISEILAHKTVIVIAHRLSTIQQADRILVLEAGEIIESGTHDILLKNGKRYAELVEAGQTVSKIV